MDLSCNVCLGSEFQIKAHLESEIDGREYKAVKCINCGLIFAHPLPPLSYELLQDIYGEDYAQGQRVVLIDPKEDEALQLAVHRQLDIVERFVDKGLALNIGAMSKSNIVFEERGWGLHIVEVSQYAAETAREMWDLDITISRIEDFSGHPNTYDFIKLGHVVEHLFDPRMVVEKLAKLLKPGGVILIETDNAKGIKTQLEFGIRIIIGEQITAKIVQRFMKKNLLKRYGRLTPPEHVYLFSEKNLSRLLTSVGLSIIDVFKPSWGNRTWFPLPNMNRFGIVERVFIAIDKVGSLFDYGDVLVILARKDE